MFLCIILIVLLFCISIFLFSLFISTKKELDEISKEENELEKLRRERNDIEQKVLEKQKRNDEIEKNILVNENELKNLKEKKVDVEQGLISVQQSMQDMTQRTEEARAAFEQLTANLEENAKIELDKRMKAIEEHRLAQLEQDFKAKMEQYAHEESIINEKIEPLRRELEDYVQKRAAIIETIRREEELKDKESFHKIDLSQEAIDDIAYIESILTKIHKRDIIAKVVWEAYIQVPTKEMLNRVVGTTKKSGIYRITNIESQQCYVGQGVDLARRLTEHIKGTLGIQSIADQRIHHVMAEKGLQNWTFEILEECPKEKLNERERFWINFYKSNEYGYNKTVGNKGGKE